MISKEILRQVVVKQKKETGLKLETIKRDLLEEVLKWMSDPRVIILTGVRRCGKSTMLKQIMAGTTQWSYVNFEDERLLDFRAQDFETLNEVLIETYGPTMIYFFDEIQNIDKFETFVRRLQDEGKKVVITGSNATLLSREFGTRLTGRYKSFEIYPFSFSEYLKLKNMAISEFSWRQVNQKVALLKVFDEYLITGGLPEYIKNKDEDYVRTVFENILYKDIITRYSIKREKILKELVNILATNATSKITYNSLKNALKLSNAITVKEYLNYLSNSYLFFELLRISHSIKKQLASPRKIYLVDSAFNQVCGLTFTPNKGRNLENAVFIELKRKGDEVYYYFDKNECDFVVKKGARVTAAIQVCYTLDETNKERELKGLLDAMNVFNLKTGTIITFEQTEDLTVGRKQIMVLPFLKWALKDASR